MNYQNFEEYFSSNLKINDDNLFKEKLDLLLSNDKNQNQKNKNIENANNSKDDNIVIKFDKCTFGIKGIQNMKNNEINFFNNKRRNKKKTK